MYYEIYMISLATKDSDIPINNFIRKLPNRLYKKYLMKKQPVEIKDINFIGEEGKNLILPFTNTSIQEQDKEYVEKFISKLLLKYEIKNVYSSHYLKKYIQQEKVSYQSLLKYIMLDQIIVKVLKDHNTTWKNTKLVIIDSEDGKMDYLLELFVENLNYLTIITKREEYFKEIKEIIYLNTGLVIEIIDNPTKESINGNIIIDANKDICKNYSYFEKDAILIDLESNNTKMQYAYSRRKDIQIVYDVILTAREEEIENDLLGYILCSRSFICSNFVRNIERSYKVKDFFDVRKLYNIKLKELKKVDSLPS